MTEPDLLGSLVAAEHAALYGYGVLGARLDEDGRLTARAASDSHRMRRDALSSLLRDRSAPVPSPAAAYDVAVTGPAEALSLAVRLEEGLSLRWRDLVGGTDDPALRRLAVDGLSETAVRAAQWRRRAALPTPTVAFPGTA